VSYHTRAISMNIVRATAWTLHDAAQKAKGRLCGKRAGRLHAHACKGCK